MTKVLSESVPIMPRTNHVPVLRVQTAQLNNKTGGHTTIRVCELIMTKVLSTSVTVTNKTLVLYRFRSLIRG